MTLTYTLTTGFVLIFTLIGLFACALIFVRALDGLVAKFKRHDTAKTKQMQSAKNWLAAISNVVQLIVGIVTKVLSLRANAKRRLEARIQNQHALQHVYSKF